MKKIFSFIVLGILATLPALGQELNCNVSVLSPQIQSSDKKVFTTLQTAIYEFMNNTRWTNDQFANQERIECSIQINVTERVSSDEFKATIQIQSRRPVYKTSYYSPIISLNDENLQFRYIEFQTLEFNESATNPNLVAVLAFYAYVIIGMDYDSYSPLGGTAYFQKAQSIVSNMQNSPEKGWRAFEGSRNRYWLAENINNPVFRPVRTLLYEYHRKGMDILSDKKDDAINAIAESIEGLRPVFNDKPGNYLMQSLFFAKSDEIVNVFGGAFPETKTRMINTLSEFDPSNGTKYQGILNKK